MPYVDFDYLDRMRFNLNSHIQGKTYAWVRKLTQMVNKLKIETSISLRMRDEEVEIHGKSNCWDIGRR